MGSRGSTAAPREGTQERQARAHNSLVRGSSSGARGTPDRLASARGHAATATPHECAWGASDRLAGVERAATPSEGAGWAESTDKARNNINALTASAGQDGYEPAASRV